jgi:RNA polymerase sigma-70 factor (ECF subfamily)
LNEVEKTEKLVDEHGKSVYNFCVYLAKNKMDGDDLFQETFLRAMELSGKINRQGNPKSYLLSIAVNLWRNMVKKNARRTQIISAVELDADELYQVADMNSITEDIVFEKITNDDLSGIINNLEDKHRIPVILFYSEEMKISEISSVINKPEGSVKRLLSEARNKIKTEMEGLGYGR